MEKITPDSGDDVLAQLDKLKAEAERKKAEGIIVKTAETKALIGETTDMAEGNARLNQRTMKNRRVGEGPVAQYDEIRRIYDPVGTGELVQDILTLEERVKVLDARIAETRSQTSESGIDASEILAKSEAKLGSMRADLESKQAELIRRRREGPVKARESSENWQDIVETQRAVSTDPVAFAAKTVLEGWKLAGKESRASEEELAQAVKVESRRRLDKKQEQYEVELEDRIQKELSSIIKEVQEAKKQIIEKANRWIEMLKDGSDISEDSVLALFEEAKITFEELKKESYWFNRKAKEKARDLECAVLIEEMKKLRERAEVFAQSVKLSSELFAKGHLHTSYEIKEPPRSPGYEDDSLTKVDFDYPGINWRFKDEARKKRVQELQDQVKTETQKVQDDINDKKRKLVKLIEEKMEVPRR